MILAALAALGASSAGEALFRDDPKAAFRLARESERPLLIEFHTTWCEACEKMQRSTWRDGGVLTLIDDFVALSVDGDRNANLVSRYDVKGYPTIVLAEPGGEPILVLLGYQDAGTLRGQLGAVLGNWDELRALAVEAVGGRSEATALVGLGDFALAGGAHVHAEQCYRRALRQGKALPDDLLLRARVGLIEVLAATDRCREAVRILKRAKPVHVDDLAARTEQVFREPGGSCRQQP